MARGPAAGYVFGIADPRLTAKGKPDIVFVGNGNQPWLTVRRHLERSRNPEVAKWAAGLHKDFPEGLIVHGEVICERFHGDAKPLPETPPGVTVVEWRIFGIDVEELDDDGRVSSGTLKSKVIAQLRKEGHPLLNKTAGRPKADRAKSHQTLLASEKEIDHA